MSHLGFFIFVILYYSYAVLIQTVPQTQINALYELYNATNGANWKWRDIGRPIWNFSNTNDICTWQALICSCHGNACNISQISLHAYRLNGSIPEIFSALPALIKLDLAGNRIRGHIPTSIGIPTGLVVVELSANIFTGPLPSEFGQLRQVTALYLQKNKVSGAIPSAIGDMASLTALALQENMFSSTIPSTLGKLFKMSDFHLEHNLLTGRIPHDLGNLSQIIYFYARNNLLTGELPSSLGKWSNCVDVEVQGNFLSSTLPASFIGLSSMIFFYTRANFFTGNIPEFINNWRSLNELALDNNYYSGTIPSQFGSLTNLGLLLLSNNYLSGNSIEFLGDCESLYNLDISYNQFSGELPTELFHSNNLIGFLASVNCFHGSIPTEICNAVYLERLELSGLASAQPCRDTIPGSLNDAIYLPSLISGGIPECLFALPDLVALYISGNGIGGKLAELPAYTVIENISLSHNQLTGVIPLSFQYYHGFVLLDLSFNHLSGTLQGMYNYSESLEDYYHAAGFLNYTKTLRLINNRLSGVIPNQLVEANSSVDILSGNLFECRSFQRNLPKTDPLRNNYICGSDEVNGALYITIIIIGLLGVAVITMFVHSQWHSPEVIVLRANLKMMFNMWRIEDSRWIQHDSLRDVHTILSFFRSLCSLICLFICVVNFPVFSMLKRIAGGIYSTHTYEYGWTISLGFLGGEIPARLVAVLWCSLVALMAYRLTNVWSKMDLVYFKIASGDQWKRRVLLNILYIVMNLGLVSFVNGLYVYTLLFYSSGLYYLITAGVIIFKLAWNPFICRLNAHPYVLLCLMILNNVLIPIFATLLVDVSCFRYVIVTPPAVDGSYYHEFCAVSATSQFNYTCLFHSYNYQPGYFYPPFVYSYQCGSALLVNYVPIFVVLFLLTGVILPALGLCITTYAQVHRDSKVLKYSNFLFPWVPISSIDRKLLTTLELSTRFDQLRVRYDIQGLCFRCIVGFLVLCTFGFAYPPLAILVWIKIIFSSLLSELNIQLHFAECRRSGDQELFNAWETLCTIDCRRKKKLFFGSLGIQILVASCFISLFLFDTGNGLGSAVVSIIICGCLIFCAYNSEKLSLFQKKVALRVVGVPLSMQEDSISEIELVK